MTEKATFIKFLFRHRRVLLINFIVVLLLAVLYAFVLMKKEYRASMTFLPPVSESLGGFSIMGISLPSLSGGAPLTDQVEAIFYSRAIKRRIIDHFDFYDFFRLKKNPNKFEWAVRKLRKYVELEPEEKGGFGLEKTIAFSLTTYHRTPDSAKLLCDFSFSLLDSAVRNISMSRARRTREFVEKQLVLNKGILDSMQAAFSEFQIANKAFAVPEQVKLSLKSFAEIKSAAILNELKMRALRQEFSGMLPELEELQQNDAVYRQKLAQLESGTTPDVLPSLGLSAELLPRYTNLLREIEVRTQVILLLEKELEQARLQESRDISALLVIDPPYVPEYKTRPKRLASIASVLVIEHLLVLLVLAALFYYSPVKRYVVAQINGRATDHHT